ncbi:MAG: cystathionine beta-synthase [Brevundimonas sp.]
MRYAEHISELVGGTPLVRLSSVTAGLSATVLAKVEYLNPGGSVKDRIALAMVEAAERSGELGPGGTIVEPTSGNTGVGLALVAQRKGYRCIFVCPDKVARDKIDVLRAYGAEVVVTPTAVPPDHPDSYYSVSDRLVSEIAGAWKPNQYANPQGPASHYASTGPEIWADTEGQVTHLVAAVGTGGTITGTGRYLHDVGAVTVVGIDPLGSVYSGGDGRPYLVEGVGEDFWPPAYDPSVPDRIIAVSDAESFAMTRRLAREEALLVGGSAGMAVEGALRVARELEDEDPVAAARAVIVVILADGGRGYLSKIFDDGWMRSYGFLGADEGATVADVVRTKTGSLPDLVHTHPNETVRDAIEILHEFGVSQMPVVGAEPPVKIGEVAGAVSERALLDAVFSGAAALSDRVDRHMSAPLPLIGIGESVAAARSALEGADALMVVDDGQPVGVLTRHDLLGFLAR